MLTGEEIRRLGVTTLPDALRYVPGMDVAMINSSQWAVSSRGFNGQYANQLLVMMDGRSIYNPTFGGVIWAGQDTLFNDIERIEVVRGPGGTLWGANAVNGVINILTKSAKETQGTILTGGGGAFYESVTAARHGFKLSDTTFGRVYAKYDQFGETPLANGGNTPDDWNRLQGGFRLDSIPDDATSFTLQGDVRHMDEGAIYLFPSFTAPRYVLTNAYRLTDKGANLLGRWTRRFSEDSVVTAQAYYDYSELLSKLLLQRLHTLDVDLQHNFAWGERQKITWGTGYRATWDTVIPTQILSVPGREQANDQLFSLFGQDEIALAPEILYLTLGTKFEHNDYTGMELQPSGRLNWHPAKRQTVWGAISRAVATPNHLSAGMAYNNSVAPPGALGLGSPATLVQILGQSDRAEELLAYELGYRIQPSERVSADITAFYCDYSQLLMTQPGKFLPGTPPILPINWVNRSDGHTYGVELSLGWQPLDCWRLQGNCTWFNSDVTQASVGRGDGDASPQHKFGVRSSVDIGRHWQWDTGLRYVNALRSLGVPAYLELDVRLAWIPNEHWEIALVGQSLLHDSHFEFPRGLSPLRSESPRSVYGVITFRF